jgi:nicotinate phosphoribosyltransferase
MIASPMPSQIFVETITKLSTLLVDTYDTEKGAEIAAEIAIQLRQSGVDLQSLRLDSGDLADLSKKARNMLDAAGLNRTSIFASGNLDEYKLAELVRAQAPIEAFGVGTAMVVSSDAPALDITYKLVEYAGKPRCKTSRGKVTLPGHKQVFRSWDPSGSFYFDLVGLAEELTASVAGEFEPAANQITELLKIVYEDGQQVEPPPTLARSREQL